MSSKIIDLFGIMKTVFVKIESKIITISSESEACKEVLEELDIK